MTDEEKKLMMHNVWLESKGMHGECTTLSSTRKFFYNVPKPVVHSAIGFSALHRQGSNETNIIDARKFKEE